MFGEKKEDRRERLRSVIVRQRQAQGMDIDMADSESEDGDEDDDEDEKEEEFYTEGDETLENARRWMAAYSLPRAKRRVQRQRMEANLPLGRILDTRKGIFAELKASLSLSLTSLILSLPPIRIMLSIYSFPPTDVYFLRFTIRR